MLVETRSSVPMPAPTPSWGGWRWLGRALKGVALISLLWAVFACGMALLIHTTASINERRSADVIIVLGAGINRDGSAGRALTRRAIQAAELYQQGYAPFVLCTGGMPVRRPRTEAQACAQVLRERGVPDSAIVLEEQSRSTEENALYSLQTMQAQAWSQALVVSDGFHMWRTRLIFGSYGIQAHSVGVQGAEDRLLSYSQSVVREVAAVHWYFLRRWLNIDQTYVAGI